MPQGNDILAMETQSALFGYTSDQILPRGNHIPPEYP